MNVILISLILGLLLGAFLSFSLFKNPTRKKRLQNYDFPEGWEQHLRENIPLFSFLSRSTREKFKRELQWALDRVQVVGLGDQALNVKQRLLILAPFVLLDWAHSKNGHPKNLRLLILDQTNDEDFIPKLDPHDFLLSWSEHEHRVFSAKPELSTKNLKTMQKIFGEHSIKKDSSGTLLMSYQNRFRRPLIVAAKELIEECLGDEIYLASDQEREVIAWSVLELLCFNPQEVKKCLPKTYQALFHFYQFNTPSKDI